MSVIINAATTGQPIDAAGRYHEFLQRETESTGTIVMHHGRVKYPGKRVKAFHRVVLSPLVDDPDAALADIGRQAALSHHLHQVSIIHRLGVVGRGDDILLVVVSAATRKQAFAGCAFIVDEIKEEKIISLLEQE
ncbi:MAG: molybdenum cofactor biosynthesis protein MoaE [Deltaproteobacteria bacterium]|nr:MAG: molybdenum cofactor biosynthesis protein MoaE [Deltaproteobacteria bacterium]